MKSTYYSGKYTLHILKPESLLFFDQGKLMLLAGIIIL